MCKLNEIGKLMIWNHGYALIVWLKEITCFLGILKTTDDVKYISRVLIFRSPDKGLPQKWRCKEFYFLYKFLKRWLESRWKPGFIKLKHQIINVWIKQTYLSTFVTRTKMTIDGVWVLSGSKRQQYMSVLSHYYKSKLQARIMTWYIIQLVWFGLFNSISTPYGLFNAEI